MKEQRIETAIEGFTIRFATSADVRLILDFIRLLADYEKLSHEVVATADDLHQNLFGDVPKAEVVIGEYNREAVSFALFFHSFSTFLAEPGIYLEDLFVKPAARGNGFGRAMLSYLARLAVERGCGRLEWRVLNWNRDAIRFYEKLGAEAMDEWTTYRLAGNNLEKLAQKFKT